MNTTYRLLIVLLAFTTQLVASPLPDFPFTSVYGSATQKVAPDQATIKFTVLSHDKSSEAAVSSVNGVLTKLVTDLIKLGIKKENLVADDLSKEAVREKGANYKKLKVIGYNVSREVKVTVSEIQLYTKVARLIMATDQVTRVSSEFDTSKRDELHSALMTSACEDAKKKAKSLCEGVGSQLGDVFAVSGQDFTNLSSRFGFGYSGSHFSGAEGLLPSIRGGAAEVPVFVPTNIEIRASVNVLYRLGSASNSK